MLARCSLRFWFCPLEHIPLGRTRHPRIVVYIALFLLHTRQYTQPALCIRQDKLRLLLLLEIFSRLLLTAYIIITSHRFFVFALASGGTSLSTDAFSSSLSSTAATCCRTLSPGCPFSPCWINVINLWTLSCQPLKLPNCPLRCHFLKVVSF